MGVNGESQVPATEPVDRSVRRREEICIIRRIAPPPFLNLRVILFKMYLIRPMLVPAFLSDLAVMSRSKGSTSYLYRHTKYCMTIFVGGEYEA